MMDSKGSPVIKPPDLTAEEIEDDYPNLKTFDELMQKKIGELQISPKEVKWLPRVEVLKASADSGYKLYAYAKIGDFEFVSEPKKYPDRKPIGDLPAPREWKILEKRWQREFEEKALLYINNNPHQKDIWAILENGIRSRAEFDLDKLVRMILKTKKEPAEIHLIIPPVQLENILIEIVKGLRLQEEMFQLTDYRLNLLDDRFNEVLKRLLQLIDVSLENLEAARMPWWRKLLPIRKPPKETKKSDQGDVKD